MDITKEMIERGAQALVHEHWHPPQSLKLLAGYQQNKYRDQARRVLEAALNQPAGEIANVLASTGNG